MTKGDLRVVMDVLPFFNGKDRHFVYMLFPDKKLLKYYVDNDPDIGKVDETLNLDFASKEHLERFSDFICSLREIGPSAALTNVTWLLAKRPEIADYLVNKKLSFFS